MDPFRGADKKLGELMLRGWTLLGDTCPEGTCRCPLMKSPDGQKYCVNCEVWVYKDNKKEPKKYEELFSSRNIPLNINKIKQEKKIKEENIIKEKEKDKKIIIQKINEDKNNESVIDILNNKLKKLSNELNNEDDIKKCEEIVKLMEQILSLIEHYKKIL